MASRSALRNTKPNDVIFNGPISVWNYFLPERIPCFMFDDECKKLVSLLDDLSTAKTKPEKRNRVCSTFVSMDLQKLHQELNKMTTFELECCHCVIGWLLHVIYFELSIQDPTLESVAAFVGNLLNVTIGGSSNASFAYNWQHVTLKPNSIYDARALNDENIVARFKILSTDESDSLWYFIKGHILMEARACDIFDGIMAVYTTGPHGSLILLRETLSSICIRMKEVLATMSTYMHKNKVLLKHWPKIQQLLKLPGYDGIVGLQNCWILAMNFVVNVKPSDDPELRRLEANAWKYLLPHQRDWIVKFKDNSNYLMALCKSYHDNQLFSLFEKLVEHVITWRAIHRSRASQFIGSTLENTYESTGSGRQKKLSEIQNQWDGRIKDFLRLKKAIRRNKHLSQFCRDAPHNVLPVQGTERRQTVVDDQHGKQEYNRDTKKRRISDVAHDSRT